MSGNHPGPGGFSLKDARCRKPRCSIGRLGWTYGGAEVSRATRPRPRNALADNVADRIELHTADMTALPFEADSFDLVVSNVALHNVKVRAGRQKAIEEAVRVLRPGGRLLIADLMSTRLYQTPPCRVRLSS
jgi:SAM-dependent methyltransferase